jgi:hypothetical protein
MQYYGKFMDFVYDNLVSAKLSEEDIDVMEQEAATSIAPQTNKYLSVSKDAINTTETTTRRTA